MGDPNRIFREVVPRQKCQNYCHEPAFPNRRSGRISVSSRIDDVDTAALNLPMAQMDNPFFRNAQVIDERRSISVSDWESGKFGPQAHPDWTKGRFAMSSAGSTFEAIRIHSDSGGSATAVTLQWESQNFSQAATRWEARYSPLMRRGLSGEIIPIIDELYEVVGYFIPRCTTVELFRGKDGELYYVRKNDLADIGVGSDAKALRDILKVSSPFEVIPGVQTVNGGHDVAYDLVADVNGMIISDVRVEWSATNGSVESVDWVFDLFTAGPALARLSLLLGKKLVVSTAKGASKMVMKSLVRIGLRRSAQTAEGRILETPRKWLEKVLMRDRKIPVKLVDPTRLSSTVGPFPRGGGALHPHPDPAELKNSAGSISKERALHPHPDWAPAPGLSAAEKKLARPQFTERGYFDITSKKTYLVRAEGQAQGAGRWGDDLFESLDEAETYVRKRLVPVGKARIKEQSALPDTWIGGATGNTADKVVIYEVPERTPFIRGVVGEQFEAGGAKLYQGGGPQVVLGITPKTLRSLRSFSIPGP